jgi:hypothetical protein
MEVIMLHKTMTMFVLATAVALGGSVLSTAALARGGGGGGAMVAVSVAVISAETSVVATWPDTSVVSMAAMSMADFATVSAATAIRPTVVATALLMAAIRSVDAATNDRT